MVFAVGLSPTLPPGSPPPIVAALAGRFEEHGFRVARPSEWRTYLDASDKGYVRYAWQDAENAEQRLHQHRPTGRQFVYGAG